MKTSVREARAQFATALSAAERGERVTTTTHGKAIAEVGPPSAVVKKSWDWESLDLLQEKLGIPTPAPGWEEWLDSEELNKEIWAISAREAPARRTPSDLAGGRPA